MDALLRSMFLEVRRPTAGCFFLPRKENRNFDSKTRTPLAYIERTASGRSLPMDPKPRLQKFFMNYHSDIIMFAVNPRQIYFATTHPRTLALTALVFF